LHAENYYFISSIQRTHGGLLRVTEVRANGLRPALQGKWGSSDFIFQSHLMNEK
jgi:hypothetical protein